MQPVEGCEIRDRIVGIPGVKNHVRRVHPFPETQLVDLEDDLAVELDELEYRHVRIRLHIRVLHQDILDEADPHPAAAGFPVRDTADMAAHLAAELAEDAFGVSHRYAADEMGDRC